MTTARAISRRRLLRGLGGAALAIPFLPSLAGESQAGSYTPPKRFIFVFSSNGQRQANWWPTWQPSWTDLGADVREAPLQTDGSGHITPILGPEFSALRDKLLLIRGLDQYKHGGDGHEPTSVLSGNADGGTVTMDQVLAYSNKVYGAPPPVRSVHMLIKQEYEGMGDGASVDLSDNVIPHETNVLSTYDRLFGNYVEPDADPTIALRHAKKLGVIDRLRDEYDVLRKSPRLGAEDRKRLEAHLEHIHDLRARLDASGGPMCTKPDEPPDLSDAVLDNLPAITQNNIDLLVSAVKCDQVRVATLMLCPGTDLRDFGFLGLPGGEHHAHSHITSGSADEPLCSINNWYAQKVADLLTQLDVVEDTDSGATYLDNSVVYWGNEDGCNDFDAHKPFAMPVLVAGSCGGAIRTGRYLDYRKHGTPIHYGSCGSGGGEPTDDQGRPYNSLLISLMSAMGLEAADWEAAPGAGFGNYDDNFCNGYSQSDGRAPLPFFAA